MPRNASDRPSMENQREPNYIMGKEDKMPLHKGKSDKVKEENFHELKESNPKMPNKQRVAIVLNTARKSNSNSRHKEHR